LSTQHLIDQAQQQTGGNRPQGQPFKAEWHTSLFLVCNPKGSDPNIYEVQVGDLQLLNSNSFREEFDLTRYAGFLAVQVHKSNHRDFPGHRFTLGAILPNGRFVPNISPRVEGQRTGQPLIDDSVWETTIALWAKAREYQQTDVTIQADRYVQRTSTPRGEIKAPPKGIGKPGKTDRERAKGKAKPKS
jgi:hypothetical protein